jgi:hypothetical protein
VFGVGLGMIDADQGIHFSHNQHFRPRSARIDIVIKIGTLPRGSAHSPNSNAVSNSAPFSIPDIRFGLAQIYACAYRIVSVFQHDCMALFTSLLHGKIPSYSNGYIQAHRLNGALDMRRPDASLK